MVFLIQSIVTMVKITICSLRTDLVLICFDLRHKPSEDPLYERFGSLEYTGGGWVEEGGVK